MNYYRIGFYYKNNCGIYEHLPIKGEVTTDKNVAEKWFNLAVRQYKQRDHCYKVSEVRERELDFACYIKQIHVVCDEPAYMQGEYLVELQCYQHNPNL